MSPYHADLFNKLLRGELSPEEAEVLVSWLGAEKLDTQTEELLAKHLAKRKEGEISATVNANLENRLQNILGGQRPQPVVHMRWMRYAAILILVLGMGTFLMLVNKRAVPSIAAEKMAPSLKNDVEPGKQGAVLTLADGRSVVLDSLQNGVIATQNGSKILLNNGHLIYDKHSLAEDNAQYNVITTPRGRQFQLTLADGTQVWLNAGSSLRYPTYFDGKERKVEITGEAYFEVAKNVRMPFKVSINNETEIEVLGTHFNVNAYENEATINTTLLEGSVKVRHNSENDFIKPGQQLQVAQPNNSFQKSRLLNNVNITRIMAWKDGVFDFEDATLSEVMHQLERWYDIDVVYEKGIPKLEFYGRVGRDLTLSNLLRGLRMSKVNFRLEGRQLVVLP